MQIPPTLQVIVSLLPLVVAGCFLGYWLSAADAGERFYVAFAIAEALGILTWLGTLFVATAAAKAQTFLWDGVLVFLAMGLPGLLLSLVVGAVVGGIVRTIRGSG